MSLFRRVAAFVAACAVAGCSGGTAGTSWSPAGARTALSTSSGSIANAYTFLDMMMDRYATGSTTRLVRSYDGGGNGNFSDAFVYDDAVMIDALLARGTSDDIARAQAIGNALVYVQAHDSKHDGRLRAAYLPRPLLRPSDVIVTSPTVDDGNMAWAGQALVQLYSKTKNVAYLNAASAIATWIVRNTYSTKGPGGYTGGETPAGKKIPWKSTEHNIDISAFLSMLALQQEDSPWTTRAAWAQRFVAAMWSAKQERFFVGTGNNGVTPYVAFKPEDINSWSYLAFENPQWAASPTWDVKHLAVNAGGFSGVSFCSGDRAGVWFEGTAHLADALELRNQPGDAAQAQAYLSDIAYAQTNGLNGDGLGIISASINRLSDCDGDFYYASLHVGATAWYVLAASAANPFKLL